MATLPREEEDSMEKAAGKRILVYPYSLTWVPDPEERASRKDLRRGLVKSIVCKDVDDALSVKKLENGNLEVGVHIADVTHFVPVNSLSDLEARKRATTVYLADRRYDMLPPVISEKELLIWSQLKSSLSLRRKA